MAGSFKGELGLPLKGLEICFGLIRQVRSGYKHRDLEDVNLASPDLDNTTIVPGAFVCKVMRGLYYQQ